MTKARLLLVVPESSGMTTSRRAEYQAVADKIGAELLITSMGCETQLLEVPLLTEVLPASSDAPFRKLAGGIAYSPEVIGAFRLLEPLLNAGEVKLVYDRWARGELRFMPPHTLQPSALLTVAAEFVEPKVRRHGALLCGLLAGAVSAVAVGAGLMLLGKLWL